MKIKNIFFIMLVVLFNQQSKAEDLVVLQPATKHNIVKMATVKTKNKNVFKNQNIIDKNFSGKNISEWKIKDCTMANANFGGCCALKTSILKSKLAFVNISNKATILKRIFNFLTKNSFYAKNKIGMKFTKSTIIETNFYGSILIDSEFYQTDIIKSNFENTISVNADFVACSIIDTTFRGSILTYADFSGSTLKNVDLRNCILIGSNFEDATLENVLVKDVDFRGVYISEKQKEYLNQNGAKNAYWEDNLL